MANLIFFMDPLETLQLEKDTTLQIIKEGIKGGHHISIFHDEDLAVRDGEVIVKTRKIITDENDIKTVYDNNEEILTKYDILFVRRDPPVDMEFYSSLSILSSIDDEILCLNRPSSILLFPEKIWPATFKQFHPPTLISKRVEDILNFKKKHRNVVIKPLFNYCGNGIYISLSDDRNFKSIISMHKMMSNHPVLIQKFISDVDDGDRRIIMLGGEPIGAINRKASLEDFRCNMYAGGTPTLHTLSKTEQDICTQIGPTLKKMGLHLVGIDIIGDYITEINTTAPTGIFQIAELGGPNLCENVIAYAEGLLSDRN